MRNFALKIHWILSSQFGLNLLLLFRSIRGLPYFIRDWYRYRKNFSGRLDFMPCLHDRFEEGGVTKSEYFWQDLLVSQWIFKANPVKHVDVGSRVDGFVAHVASFREIEIIDVRPISTSIPGVTFMKGDLMEESLLVRDSNGSGYCDSLSCLHSIEHFGLGRYGDEIDTRGHEKGIKNLAALLKPDGIFYLSTPIGIERVEFNANRVFDPRTIIDIAEKNQLALESLIVITKGTFSEIPTDSENLKRLANEKYNLGLFTFKRLR